MTEINFNPGLTLDQIDLEMLFIMVFVIVDDLYHEAVPDCVLNRLGPDASLFDSEIITLSLVGEMFFDSESSWINFVARNYRHLFPKLNERSRFHRCNKDLWVVKNLIRHKILEKLNATFEHYHLVDSMPLPICKYAQAKRCRLFLGEVEKDQMFGVCASKTEKIYGFKLHLLVTVDGIIGNFVLTPPAPHDIRLMSKVVEGFNNMVIGADKGYISKTLKATLEQTQQIILITPKRSNQVEENTKIEKWFLTRYRKTIKTVNSILSEQFHITRTRARKIWGLFSKIISKITSLTICNYINKIMGRPILQVKAIAL